MNAIIMAAGTASRFVPLSEEIPKALLTVRGEVLIERQIRQLKEAGVPDIVIVLGYKAEMFHYLVKQFKVRLVYNEDFERYNNTSSMIRVVNQLEDSFICCSDHYFTQNVFLEPTKDSYYSALYASGCTNEYCIQTDANDWITNVHVGGNNAWYMAGHVFFNEAFSSKFRSILIDEYSKEETRYGYWEDVFIKHLSVLPMKVRKYGSGIINEFDSIDELRSFDHSYLSDTRSPILKSICASLSCDEADLSAFKRIKSVDGSLHFSFLKGKQTYEYDGQANAIKML